MEKSNDILIPEFERLINLGPMVEFVPRGESMRPFIEGGRNKVILRTCREPKVGHIVLAKVNDSYVLHRIYEIRGKKIILRGDGNLTGYEICKVSDIIGRVVRIKGKDGRTKRLTKGSLWRHMPLWMRKFYLKIYRHYINWVSYYED